MNEVEQTTPSVLVVDDEPPVARATERILSRRGYRITTAGSGKEALEKSLAAPFDAIISDLRMPDMDGRALLRAVRANDLDVPFIFLTGSPDLQSAIEAVEYGAFRYLIKPAEPDDLVEVVKRAVVWRRLAAVRRDIAREFRAPPIGDRAGLEARYEAALGQLWMATQPIVRWRERTIIAYETLLRTDEPTLRNPDDFFNTAERLGRAAELGSAVRRSVSRLIASAPKPALVFVNLHPAELDDAELYDERGPLAEYADRIVLEITERAALDGVPGRAERVARLRRIGYRIAVDDLGAGYAGLSSLAILEPDIVKADMSLVRGINDSAIKQKLVGAIADLANDLDIQFVAEGVETAAERDCVDSLGAHALQGYLFARPARGFPSVTY